MSNLFFLKGILWRDTFFYLKKIRGIFLDLNIWHENCLSVKRKIILQRAQSF